MCALRVPPSPSIAPSQLDLTSCKLIDRLGKEDKLHGSDSPTPLSIKLLQRHPASFGTIAQAPIEQELRDLFPLTQGDGSQEYIFQRVRTRAIQCVNGPPGSGKTYFSAVLILRLMFEALGSTNPAGAGRPDMRVMVTAPTHEAMNNVLAKLTELLGGDAARAYAASKGFELPDVYKVQYEDRSIDVGDTVQSTSDNSHRYYVRRLGQSPATFMVEPMEGGAVFEIQRNDIKRWYPFTTLDSSVQARPALKQKLARKVIVVGCTAYQMSAVLDALSGGSLFDLLLVDEASQVTLSPSSVACSPATITFELLLIHAVRSLAPYLTSTRCSRSSPLLFSTQVLLSHLTMSLPVLKDPDATNGTPGRLVLVGDTKQMGPLLHEEYPEGVHGAPPLHASILRWVAERALSPLKEGDQVTIGAPAASYRIDGVASATHYRASPVGGGSPQELPRAELDGLQRGLVSTLKENHRMTDQLARFTREILGYDKYRECHRRGCPCSGKWGLSPVTREPAGVPPLQLHFAQPLPANTARPQALVRTALGCDHAFVMIEIEPPAGDSDQTAARDDVESSRVAEAALVAELIATYLQGRVASGFDNSVFVVTPHHVQRIAVLRAVEERPSDIPLHAVKVDTVEKMQGQERDLVIACYAGECAFVDWGSAVAPPVVPTSIMPFVRPNTCVAPHTTRASPRTL